MTQDEACWRPSCPCVAKSYQSAGRPSCPCVAKSYLSAGRPSCPRVAKSYLSAGRPSCPRVAKSYQSAGRPSCPRVAFVAVRGASRSAPGRATGDTGVPPAQAPHPPARPCCVHAARPRRPMLADRVCDTRRCCTIRQHHRDPPASRRCRAGTIRQRRVDVGRVRSASVASHTRCWRIARASPEGGHISASSADAPVHVCPHRISLCVLTNTAGIHEHAGSLMTRAVEWCRMTRMPSGGLVVARLRPGHGRMGVKRGLGYNGPRAVESWSNDAADARGCVAVSWPNRGGIMAESWSNYANDGRGMVISWSNRGQPGRAEIAEMGRPARSRTRGSHH